MRGPTGGRESCSTSTSAASRSATRGSSPPGAEVLGRLGSAGDAEAQRLGRWTALVAGRDVAGEERITGPDARDRRLDGLEVEAVQQPCAFGGVRIAD